MKLLWLLCLLPLLAAGKKKTGVRELNDTNIDAALTASNDEAWLLLLFVFFALFLSQTPKIQQVCQLVRSLPPFQTGVPETGCETQR